RCRRDRVPRPGVAEALCRSRPDTFRCKRGRAVPRLPADGGLRQAPGAPARFLERERAGVLLSRLTSDVQSLTEFIREALIEVVGSALQIALTIVVLVVLSPTLAAVSLVALPILIASSWTFHHSAGRVYHAIRDRVAETLTALQEGLAGIRVVQAFRRERRTLEAYNPRSQAQIHAWRRASFVHNRPLTMIPLAQAG